jgi:hypothetical protein
VPTDAPTIQAGVDSAAAGDTVLVLPGTYYENVRIRHKDDLVLLGSGPEQTTVDGPTSGGETLVLENADGLVIEGFTWAHSGPQVIGGLEVGVAFRNNIVLYGNPGFFCGSARFECIRDSEFESNSFLCLGGRPGNLLTLNVDWPGCSNPTPVVTISQNLFWEVSNPIVWGTCVPVIEHNNLGAAGPWYPPENIFADPLLCDPGAGDYRVAANSPNLPQNNPYGVLLGALGEGCGPIVTGTTSWGVVKAKYR